MIAQYYTGTVKGTRVHIMQLSTTIRSPAKAYHFPTKKEAKEFAKEQGATPWNH